MPDKDKDKRPPPPQALRTFLNLSAAVPPQYGVDPTKPLLKPYVPTRGQVRAQQGLMGLADLVRGLTIGASDEKDSNAAQIGELIQTGAPLLSSLKALALMRGGLKIVKGAETAEEAAQAAKTGIRAYHASPHDFEQFDISKIGTGEGAQAYGHGLYFAEAEPVMEDYYRGFNAGKVRQEGVKYGDTVYPPGVMRTRTLEDLAAKGKDATVADLKRSIQFNESYAPDMANVYRAELDFALTADPAKVTIPSAHRYEVNINADPEHFLDWNKPLSEQSQKVREAVTKAYGDIRPVRRRDGTYSVTSVDPDGSGRMLDYGLQEPTAESALAKFHEAVTQQLGNTAYRDLAVGNPARASSALREAGVPGIRYLDQGSRATTGGELIDVTKGPDGWRSKVRVDRPNGEQYFTTSAPHATQEAAERWAHDKIGGGTSNYAVFDDKLIDILRKYGWLPPIAGLGALSQIDRKAVEQRPH